MTIIIHTLTTKPKLLKKFFAHLPKTIFKGVSSGCFKYDDVPVAEWNIEDEFKPKVFGEGQRVTVDGEPGTVIDSPERDRYWVRLDTGDIVDRMSQTIDV